MAREHEAGQLRLREASERYEQQMALQRMRLVADTDLRLGQVEACRWELVLLIPIFGARWRHAGGSWCCLRHGNQKLVQRLPCLQADMISKNQFISYTGFGFALKTRLLMLVRDGFVSS